MLGYKKIYLFNFVKWLIICKICNSKNSAVAGYRKAHFTAAFPSWAWSFPIVVRLPDLKSLASYRSIPQPKLTEIGDRERETRNGEGDRQTNGSPTSSSSFSCRPTCDPLGNHSIWTGSRRVGVACSKCHPCFDTVNCVVLTLFSVFVLLI